MSPIHDQGYRRYGGLKARTGTGWMVITRAGIRSQLAKRAFLGLLLLSFLPFFARAIQIYLAVNFPQTGDLLAVKPELFRQFLDQEKIAEEDRVIRRIALRGAASEGVALSRTDLVPEVTITAEGVYWHPVGAEDNDLLVTRNIFPLSESFAAVRNAFEREREHANKLAQIFNCA